MKIIIRTVEDIKKALIDFFEKEEQAATQKKIDTKNDSTDVETHVAAGMTCMAKIAIA